MYGSKISPDRPVELARAGAGLQRRAAVCRRLGVEPSGQKGKLTLRSFLFGTAWRCVPNLLPRKGEHFLCPFPCRAQHDFECAPRCSAHNQRKIYFLICNSGKSADFPELPFHGWGLGTNPLRHLALLDASFPEGGAFWVELANAVSLRGYTQKSRCTFCTAALILCNLY